MSISSSGNATFSGDVGINASPTSTYSLNVEKSDQNGLRIKSGSGSSGQYQIRSLDSDGNLDFGIFGDGKATFSNTVTATAEIISKSSLQVQTGGGTAIGSITSSSGDLVIDGDSARDIVLQSGGGNVGIGGAPSNLFDLIKDGTDGGETKFLRMLDADTDTTADTEMLISFQKYSSGTSAVDVGSIGMGVSGWGTVSSNRNTFMSFKTVASGSRVLNFKLDGNSRISLSNNDSGTSNTILAKMLVTLMELGTTTYSLVS